MARYLAFHDEEYESTRYLGEVSSIATALEEQPTCNLIFMVGEGYPVRQIECRVEREALPMGVNGQKVITTWEDAESGEGYWRRERVEYNYDVPIPDGMTFQWMEGGWRLIPTPVYPPGFRASGRAIMWKEGSA